MCNGIIGQKLGMTGVFLPDGRYVPVTMVKAGPCVVTQIKTEAVDGYNALQIGFGRKKPSRTTKPLKGHFAKSGGNCFAHLREVGVDDPAAYEVGQEIPVDLFAIGERVNVSGRSKGRGFSGVIKRHGFHGGKKTHGSKSHRIPGSIGCSAWPSKVIKGKKLAGQYGNDKRTIRNLEIVDIRPEDHILMIRGSVPGATSGLLVLNKTGAGAPKSE